MRGNFLPLDDIDEIAVELACRGRRSGPLNKGEVREVIRILNRRGYSDALIAHHSGRTTRTVVRERMALGIPGVPARWQVNLRDMGLVPTEEAA